MLFVKGSDMVLKWLVLRGAGKDEDCEAAKNAWKKVEKERSGDDGVDLASVYDGGEEEDGADDGTPRRKTFMNNPMHTASSPGTTTMEEEEEREGLLARFATREQVDAVREVVQEQVAAVRAEVRGLERQVQAAMVPDLIV
jgi:hypothetical protein